MGLIGSVIAGGIKGAADGVAKVSLIEMNNQIEQQRAETIARLQQTMRREDKVWELDEADTRRQAQAARIKTSAQSLADRRAQRQVDGATNAYQSADLSEADRQAGLDAVRQAQASGAYKQDPTIEDYATAQATDAGDYTALMKLQAAKEEHAAAREERSITRDETVRHHKALESLSRERNDMRAAGATAGKPLTTAQKVQNKQIEFARQKIAGMNQDEIRRRTAPALATGRDNPDFDPQLASRVKKAFQRKYGESDPWFDDQMQDAPEAQSTGSDDVAAAFHADPAMKGFKLGKDTPDGFEVFDQSGKLVGHWTR